MADNVIVAYISRRYIFPCFLSVIMVGHFFMHRPLLPWLEDFAEGTPKAERNDHYQGSTTKANTLFAWVNYTPLVVSYG